MTLVTSFWSGATASYAAGVTQGTDAGVSEGESVLVISGFAVFDAGGVVRSEMVVIFTVLTDTIVIITLLAMI